MTKYLPNVKEILDKYPLDEKARNFIKNARDQAKKIYLKEDNKIIIFVGPCSFHDEEELVDYAINLKRISTYANQNIYIIMRFFPEKARSSIGWKGFLYDPFLDGSNNIEQGLIRTRKLMLKLTELEIPLATEMLDPFISNYFKDLITWGFIGSRTATSQTHRQLASSMPFCVGMKNSDSGNLTTAINNVLSARSPHSYVNISPEEKLCAYTSAGNLFSHITLRGSDNGKNCDRQSILRLYNLMKTHNLYSPIVIDCAHGNSNKSIPLQKKCFQEVITQAKSDKKIIGVMIESFLNEGNQKMTDKYKLKYGVSITDPCICFDDTRALILWANEHISNRHIHIIQ